MFHAVLYAGAVYLAPLEGKTESEDTVYHLNQTISIVNKRLSEQRTFGEAEPRFQDSIIAAISCLALGEVRCSEHRSHEWTANRSSPRPSQEI